MTVERHEVALDRLADIYVAVPAADPDAVAGSPTTVKGHLSASAPTLEQIST